MANEEHLKILREGVEKWNEWRGHNPGIRPSLERASLAGAILVGADLSEACLSSSKLEGAQLHGANLMGATLAAADLADADLGDVDLRAATFLDANLRNTNLSMSDISYVDSNRADVDNANFAFSVLNCSTLANIDLSTVKGLREVRHLGPSSIGIDTLYKSQGKIPDEFLRGAGVPEDVITHLLPLIRQGSPIQFYSCFISYSGKDEEFARRLHERMRAAGLRVWFAPEDMKGGDKLHEQLERAIQLHDRLLIVLSDHSILSPWVEREIRHAYETERKEGRRKLFPIRLTDMSTFSEWKCADSRSGKDLAEEVRQYFIPDFSNWKDHDAFEKSFGKLLADLKSEEKKPDPSIQ